MNATPARADDSTRPPGFLPRLAQVSILLGLLLPVAAVLVQNADQRSSHPCAGLSLGEVGLWPLPIGAIVLAWLGAISSVTALASAGQWLIVNLRRAHGDARWSYGGWALFLVAGLGVLALDALLLYSQYSSGLTRIADCAFM